MYPAPDTNAKALLRCNIQTCLNGFMACLEMNPEIAKDYVYIGYNTRQNSLYMSRKPFPNPSSEGFILCAVLLGAYHERPEETINVLYATLEI